MSKREKRSYWGRYRSFEELKVHEVQGEDYEINHISRDSPFAIMAPHGGYIEPGTSEIALLIAGDEHSYYSFCSLKQERGHELHITSHLFDEPIAEELAHSSECVITVHSMAGNEPFLIVGGRHSLLAKEIEGNLSMHGFSTKDPKEHPCCRGVHKENICNRGRSGQGIQIEISTGLMKELFTDEELLGNLVYSVKSSLNRAGI